LFAADAPAVEVDSAASQTRIVFETTMRNGAVDAYRTRSRADQILCTEVFRTALGIFWFDDQSSCRLEFDDDISCTGYAMFFVTVAFPGIAGIETEQIFAALRRTFTGTTLSKPSSTESEYPSDGGEPAGDRSPNGLDSLGEVAADTSYEPRLLILMISRYGNRCAGCSGLSGNRKNDRWREE